MAHSDEAEGRPSYTPGHHNPPVKRQRPDGTWEEVYEEAVYVMRDGQRVREVKEYAVPCSSPEEDAAYEKELQLTYARVMSGELRREIEAREAEARAMALLKEQTAPRAPVTIAVESPPPPLPLLVKTVRPQLRLVQGGGQVEAAKPKRPAPRPQTAKAKPRAPVSTTYAVLHDVQVDYVRKVLGDRSLDLDEESLNNRIRQHVLCGLESDRSTWVEAVEINGFRVRRIRQKKKSFFVLVDEHCREVVKLFSYREYDQLVTKSTLEQGSKRRTKHHLQRRSKCRRPMRLPRLGREKMVACA